MDETLIALNQAIQDYLEWMGGNGYAKSTQQDHRCTLRYFRLFIDVNRYHWDDIFTRRTLNRFKKAKGKHHGHAVSGLSRYLYAQGKIARPIRVRKALPVLPVVYEDYLLYRKSTAMPPIVWRTISDGCCMRLIAIANKTTSNFDH